MKNTLIFISMILCLYLVGLFINHKKKVNIPNYGFMSRDHSTIYRGIAATIIMLQHVAGGFGVRYLTPLGGVGVSIFLISSGYGLSESKKANGISCKKYWLTKLVRVTLPYLLVALAVYIYDLCFGYKFEFPYYWYIPFMFFWYVVFYFIAIIPFLYQHESFIFAVVSLFVFLFGNSLQSEQAVSFLIGILISNYDFKTITCKKRYLFLFLLVGIFLIGLKQLPVLRSIEGSYIWLVLQLIMKVSLALFFIGISYKWQRIFNSTAVYLTGVISYEFYLVHYRLLNLPTKGLVGMFLFIITTFLVSSLLYKLTDIVMKFYKSNNKKIA